MKTVTPDIRISAGGEIGHMENALRAIRAEFSQEYVSEAYVEEKAEILMRGQGRIRRILTGMAEEEQS